MYVICVIPMICSGALTDARIRDRPKHAMRLFVTEVHNPTDSKQVLGQNVVLATTSPTAPEIVSPALRGRRGRRKHKTPKISASLLPFWCILRLRNEEQQLAVMKTHLPSKQLMQDVTRSTLKSPQTSRALVLSSASGNVDESGSGVESGEDGLSEVSGGSGGSSRSGKTSYRFGFHDIFENVSFNPFHRWITFISRVAESIASIYAQPHQRGFAG